MNVDRPPASTDDPRPGAEPTRSTDPPAPENPTPPSPETRLRPEREPGQEREPGHEPGSRAEREPGQEREPAPDQQPDNGQDPELEHPPDLPSASTPPDSPANDNTTPADGTPTLAESRSRQEHATPPSADEREISAEDEAGDRDPTSAADAGTCPDGERPPTDLDGHEETGRDSVGQHPSDHRYTGDAPRAEEENESSISDDSEINEGLGLYDPDPSDADPPNDEASKQGPATLADKSPESSDDIPAHDQSPPLTDKSGQST